MATATSQIKGKPCEPADDIWSLYSKCRVLTDQVIDPDIVRVLMNPSESVERPAA